MSNIQNFNVCVKRTYKQGGEEKAFWPQIGRLTKFPATADKEEGYKLELFHMDQPIYVFEQKAKGERSAPRAAAEPKDAAGEESPDDIPF